jgi:hypothetical protein
MDNLNDATGKVRELMTDVSQPDAQGMTAGANIRASLMNANTATGNLADLSPERYRADRAFTGGSVRRVWLQGSQLFQAGRMDRNNSRRTGRR